MQQEPKKWVLILIGAPGAGKGTQAELLAEDFGLFHFETSKIIEEKLKNADPKDEEMNRQKELFSSGKLNTPELVLKWTMEKSKELLDTGTGIVFSASPRTLYEAEREMPYFVQLYGKENVKVIYIKVGQEESIRRNSNRRICAANRHPIPDFPQFKDLRYCPKDRSELVRRVFDNPEKIKVRYATYLEQTEAPILDYLRKNSWPIIEVNGERLIEAVHDDIVHGLHGLHESMHLKILAKEE